MSDGRRENIMWAQLVSTTDIDTDPIQLMKNKVTIGRNTGNDVCLSSNPFASGNHCFIEKSDALGGVWLHDTSTNGTFINVTKKIVRDKIQLHHGDEISIVQRKGDTSHNVSYLFQDAEQLLHEESTSDTSSNTLNYTQCYDTSPDESTDHAASVPAKRELSLDSGESGQIKRLRPGDAGDSQSSQDTKITPTGSTGSGDSVNNGTGAPVDLSSQDTMPFSLPSTQTEVASSSEHEQAATATAAPTSVVTPSPSSEASVAFSKSGSVGDGTTLKMATDVSAVTVESSDSQQPSTSSGVSKSSAASDEIEESLLCVICQEILHNCVSAQPCMHSFCAGCYSEWMQRSNDCPSCRMKIKRISKNHLVNNLVEAFLKSNPEKKRSEADLKELDAKNKITDEMLKIKSRHRDSSDDDTASDDDDDDDDVGISCAPPRFFMGGLGPGLQYARVSTIFGIPRPVRTVCRQCPGYVQPPGGAVGGQSLSAAGSAAGQVGVATAPPYVCSQSQVHIMCQCCMQPMPDRRHDYNPGVVLPPQTCVICQRIYCHMYWGCQRPGCHGCLGKFNEFPVGPDIMARLILDNDFESDILKRFLEARGTHPRDLLAECCRRLAAGSYTCSDQHNLAGGSTVVCLSCFRRNFAELAYQYRQDIPADELPVEARNRADCYWGRQCRTQKNKPAHARKFNHVCDQTRMA